MVVRRHTGIGDSLQLFDIDGDILVEVPERVDAISAVTTTSALVGMEHSVLIPISHRSRGHAESLGSFSYGKQFLHGCKDSENCRYLQETALIFIIFYIYELTVTYPTSLRKLRICHKLPFLFEFSESYEFVHVLRKVINLSTFHAKLRFRASLI